MIEAHLSGTTRQPPSLVIFDCDGVLIDSEIVVCRLTSEELTRLGYRVSLEEVIDRFAGRPEREMIADIEGDWGRPVPAVFFERIRQRIDEAYASELQIMPQISAILERIRINVCVASSSYPAKLALGLRSVGLYGRFEPNIISASFVSPRQAGARCLHLCRRLDENAGSKMFGDRGQRAGRARRRQRGHARLRLRWWNALPPEPSRSPAGGRGRVRLQRIPRT